MYAFNHKIQIPYKQEEINVQTSQLKSWNTTKHGTIQSVHPPLEQIKIKTPETEITASPFKKGSEKPPTESATIEDIKKVYEQNNYQSQILHTISKQVTRIEDQIDNLKQKPFPQDISPLMFKPYNITQIVQEVLKMPKSNLID